MSSPSLECFVLRALQEHTEYVDPDIIKTYLVIALQHEISIPPDLMTAIFKLAFEVGSIEFFTFVCKYESLSAVNANTNAKNIVCHDICLCPEIDAIEKYQYLFENYDVALYMSSFEKAVKKNIKVVKYYFERLVHCPQCTPMLVKIYIEEAINNDAIPVEVLSAIFENHSVPGFDYDIAKPIDYDKLRVLAMKGNAILYDSSKKEENTKVPSGVAIELMIEIFKRRDVEFLGLLRCRGNPSKYPLKDELSNEFHQAEKSGECYIDCFLESKWFQKIASLLMKFGSPDFVRKFFVSKNVCLSYKWTFFNLRANEYFKEMAQCLIELGFAHRITCSAFSIALGYIDDVAIIDMLLSSNVSLPTFHIDYFKFRLLAILNDRADIIALILKKLKDDAVDKLLDMLVKAVNVKNLQKIREILILRGVEAQRFIGLPLPLEKSVITVLSSVDDFRIADEVNEAKRNKNKCIDHADENGRAKRSRFEKY